MKRTGILIVAALALAACGGDDAVTVENAWSRTSAPEQTVGVAYFDLTVAEDDTLLGASVPSDVAERAEVHEIVMVDSSDDMEMSDEVSDEMSDDMEMSDEVSDEMSDDMEMSEGSSDMDMDTGEMRMQEMEDGLALVGGETVAFEPGSYHVMLPGLVEPLEAGDEFELTLDFATADDVTFTVQVSDDAP